MCRIRTFVSQVYNNKWQIPIKIILKMLQLTRTLLNCNREGIMFKADQLYILLSSLNIYKFTYINYNL